MVQAGFAKQRPVALVALLAATVSPAALAGGSVSVIVNFAASATSAMAVPALGNAALFALALLLGVVSVRVLRGGGAGRAAAIALFSGSLVAAGVGVERTVATSSFSVSQEGDCATGGTYAIIPRSGNIFTNDCPNAVTIEGYDFEDPSESCTLVPNTFEAEPACAVGSPVPASGACALPLCESDLF